MQENKGIDKKTELNITVAEDIKKDLKITTGIIRNIVKIQGTIGIELMTSRKRSKLITQKENTIATKTTKNIEEKRIQLAITDTHLKINMKMITDLKITQNKGMSLGNIDKEKMTTNLMIENREYLMKKIDQIDI